MKRQEMLEAVWVLQRKRNSCALHNMTFAPLPEDLKGKLEEHQKERFFSWWDSWVAPTLDFLEEELSKK